MRKDDSQERRAHREPEMSEGYPMRLEEVRGNLSNRGKALVQAAIGKIGFRLCRNRRATAADDFMEAIRLVLRDVREPVIYDVGAHHGLMALAFSDTFPGADVNAFEPFKESYHQLVQNVAGRQKIRCLNYGLADVAGILPFHVNRSSATNSLFQAEAGAEAFWQRGVLEPLEVVQVEVQTLDHAIERLGHDVVDLLKLDVQGAEPLIMAGAAEACRRGRIRAVYCEVIAQPTYAGQLPMDEQLRAYRQLGLQLFGIFNCCHSVDGRLTQFDALFVNPLIGATSSC